jgi:hypothetical protein
MSIDFNYSFNDEALIRACINVKSFPTNVYYFIYVAGEQKDALIF